MRSGMTKAGSRYHAHRVPVAAVSHPVRWYFSLQLSLRDIEEPLFESAVVVVPYLQVGRRQVWHHYVPSLRPRDEP